MKLLSLVVPVLFFAMTARASEFAAPVRMQAGGEPVRVERPGYAAPCWADIDADGKKDSLSDSSTAERFASLRISATVNSRPATG